MRILQYAMLLVFFGNNIHANEYEDVSELGINSLTAMTRLGKLITNYSHLSSWADGSSCSKELKFLEHLFSIAPDPGSDAFLAHWYVVVGEQANKVSKCFENDLSCHNLFGEWDDDREFSRVNSRNCSCVEGDIVCPRSIEDTDWCKEAYETGADDLFERCPCSELEMRNSKKVRCEP